MVIFLKHVIYMTKNYEKITKDYKKIPKITKHYEKLPNITKHKKITKSNLKLPKITKKIPKITTNDVSKPSFFIVKLATAADPPSLFSIPCARTLIGVLGKELILIIWSRKIF